MISSVFISKDLKELDSLIKNLKINKIKLFALSLIKFNSVEFNTDVECDVVFFSSSRAFTFYLRNVPLSKIKEKKIACAGYKTADFIRKYKLEIDFIPSQPGNVSQSKNEFHNWLGDQSVLYPCSNLSLKSFIKDLPNNQCQVLNVYETTFNSKELNDFDAYVFTSPSNVISFFQKNKLNNSAIVISWGDSTSQCLSKYGFKSNFTLKYGDIKELHSIFDEINI